MTFNSSTCRIVEYLADETIEKYVGFDLELARRQKVVI